MKVAKLMFLAVSVSHPDCNGVKQITRKMFLITLKIQTTSTTLTVQNISFQIVVIEVHILTICGFNLYSIHEPFSSSSLDNSWV